GIAPAAVTKVTRRGVPITATAIAVAFSILVYVWAIYIANSFFQVLVYATLIGLVSQTLVAISAIAFPYRRTALYRSSVSTKTVGGIPLMVYAGVGSIVTTIFLTWAYFHYAFFGLANKSNLFVWLIGAILFGLVWYGAAKVIRA